ncbi:unnamed protein product [Cochlearia groenlandica]
MLTGVGPENSSGTVREFSRVDVGWTRSGLGRLARWTLEVFRDCPEVSPHTAPNVKGVVRLPLRPIVRLFGPYGRHYAGFGRKIELGSLTDFGR